MSLNQPIWTYTLNNDSLTINESNNLVVLSICLQSGTGTILGSGNAGSLFSNDIALVVGQPVTFSGEGGLPLGEITITTDGVVALIGRI